MAIERSRRVRVLLAFATIGPLGILLWLGAKVVQQDAAASREQRRAVLDLAAGRLALELDRALQAIEADLALGRGIRLSPDGPVADGAALLYTPGELSAVDPKAGTFADAESLEARGQLSEAAARYRALASSRDGQVRGGALLRLARVLKNDGDGEGAVDAFGALATLGDIRVAANQPAALVGTFGKARMAADRDDPAEMRAAADQLARDLAAGAWPVDKPTFEYYCEWLKSVNAAVPAPVEIARTEAAHELWRGWRRGEVGARGRRMVRSEPGALLLSWVTTADGVRVWIAPAQAFLTSVATGPDLVVGIDHADGAPVSGRAVGGIALMPADTRLPFVLRVALSDAALAARADIRRMTLIATLAAALLLIGAALVALHRTTTRELALARQQTEFVAAVSHEFRTPLTSMRHLTDVLATRSELPDDRRSHYYRLLARETERLHRLVEGLLSFGRIEAGAYAWKLEPVDVAAIVRAIVAEFRDEPDNAARHVSLDTAPALPLVRADADALTRAVWNLLENAAKYSASAAPIVVRVTGDGSGVRIAVGDRGIGIAREERASIFQRFVRGAEARQSGVRGVGIGLALVNRIAQAHGGHVVVESEPGHGSVFTIVLPTSAT